MKFIEYVVSEIVISLIHFVLDIFRERDVMTRAGHEPAPAKRLRRIFNRSYFINSIFLTDLKLPVLNS